MSRFKFLVQQAFFALEGDKSELDGNLMFLERETQLQLQGLSVREGELRYCTQGLLDAKYSRWFFRVSLLEFK
jgi:hypothetical protein